MEKKKISLIALDMDGTLLMSDKSIHPDTVRDVAFADEQGVHMVYCSGRDIAELLPYAGALPQIRYGICTSGSIVYDFHERKNIYRRGIPREAVLDILRIIGEENGMFHFLGDGSSIARRDQIEHMEDFHMGVYKEMYRRIATAVDSMQEEALGHDSIAKVNIYFRSAEDRDRAFQKLRHLPLSFARAEETSLEMTASGVSKALGLQKLAEHLGIPMEETASIGDSDNDSAVLRAAGLSVAMGNAEDKIKEMCDMITDDNDHNGVGKAIRQIVGA
jgi:Cof subfamily protein (haloacid dehalogenase superfamily)